MRLRVQKCKAFGITLVELTLLWITRSYIFSKFDVSIVNDNLGQIIFNGEIPTCRDRAIRYIFFCHLERSRKVLVVEKGCRCYPFRKMNSS